VLATMTLVAICLVAGGLYLRRDANPGCEAGGSSACTRVLFLGNSYTSVNDLPTMFADLAWTGGHRVETGMQAPGGWTLADHDSSTETDKLLSSSKWNLVVIQEQSEIPSSKSLREANMYPAGHDLVVMARDAGAQPMLFITWAHRNGWAVGSLPDYASMQSSIDEGYLSLAAQQGAEVAPVGFAWMTLVAQESDPGLWQDDGSHPTTKGTYLAACVFYASIFHESPVGLKFHAGLGDAQAALVQRIAASTVLDNLSKWGLK
jgi:hypothetical protein